MIHNPDSKLLLYHYFSFTRAGKYNKIQLQQIDFINMSPLKRTLSLKTDITNILFLIQYFNIS
jgi:hypothetical protein